MPTVPLGRGLVEVIVNGTGGVLVTVKVVEPVLPESVAEMVLEPAATPLAKPELLLMVAKAVFELLQATEPVIFWVELSEYVPVAVNCCVVPRLIDGLVGVTAIETKVTFPGLLAVVAKLGTFQVAGVGGGIVGSVLPLVTKATESPYLVAVAIDEAFQART